MSATYTPLIPVSVGELLDKLSILEIKLARFTDAGQLENVRREWLALDAARRQSNAEGASGVQEAYDALKHVNERLWQIEDDIRAREAAGTFDDTFVALARAVYRTNDERAALKLRINTLTGSELREEKAYTAY